MKELDFDELDKAVNSLMEGVPKDKPVAKPEDEDKGTTLTISPTLSDDAKPDFANVDAQAAQSIAVTGSKSEPSSALTTAAAPGITVPTRSQAATPPASRRGGRFMDVVHPSSDMKQSTVPPRPVSRQGVTIAPAAASPAEPATSEVSDETPVKSETSSMPLSTEPMNEWPDPLDMAVFKQPDSTASDAALKENSETEEDTLVADPVAPLTSPFLADAKVEKRPLGGAAPAEPTVSDDDLLKPEEIRDDSFTTSDPNDQLPADPEKMDAPLPEELRSDLVAIESGAHMEQHTEDTTPDVPVQKEENENKKEASTEERKPASLPPASKDPSSDAAPAPTGPTSIAQQYKEEPNSGDQSTGAIYDTDTYHQPLEHPAKKKSGWMWVVWIVVILLVGAGGGAALYFLGLI